MSIVKKPILLDETGKAMVSAMHTQNALLGAIARESAKDLTSWKDIQALVKKGIAKEIFHIGDQFIVPWKDVAADKTYDVPLDIVHFGDVELQDGNIVPAMFLQWHYALPFAVQFDAPEKDEVGAGTYRAGYSYYVMQDGSPKLLTAGTDYTIGEAIPAGTYPYANVIKDPTGSIVTYGYNRWSHSAIRQFLNSKEGKNDWWTAQHIFGDIKPDQLETKAGFMTGFEDDFLSVVGPIKVTTALNIVTDEDLGNTEDTYDTFFLPSLEQMYVKPNLAGAEGDYFEYWKQATNSTSPNEVYEPNPAYITYGIDDKALEHNVALRSAYRDSSYMHWMVVSFGLIGEGGANAALRCAPVCAVY
jgi:hypothetical protein